MPDAISINISADTVAWYAAAVATLVALKFLLDFFRDKSKIVIFCKANYQKSGDKHKEKYICIKVINKGRRPICVANAAFVLKNKNKAIINDFIFRSGKEITEGKAETYWVEQNDELLKNIKYCIVYDQTGKGYKGKLS